MQTFNVGTTETVVVILLIIAGLIGVIILSFKRGQKIKLREHKGKIQYWSPYFRHWEYYRVWDEEPAERGFNLVGMLETEIRFKGPGIMHVYWNSRSVENIMSTYHDIWELEHEQTEIINKSDDWVKKHIRIKTTVDYVDYSGDTEENLGGAE